MAYYIHFTDEQKELARQTDLCDLLCRQGEKLKRSGSEYEWRDGSQKVTIRGNLWFHQYERTGGDAVDFVQRYFHKSFPEAVEYLLGCGCGTLTASPIVQREPLSFTLPKRNDNMRRVYAYRTSRRGIERDGVNGNGSAMRVSSVAWLYNELSDVRHAAKLSAEVTHNHPEGIKGAEATASAIFLARTGHSKQEIKDYVEEEFGYVLNRTCDEIRPTYHHVETCMETVPEALTAFLEGDSFEDVIRNAVSLGGDCDTLTAIAGSVAEGFYGVPQDLQEECYKRLPERVKATLRDFQEAVRSGQSIGKE